VRGVHRVIDDHILPDRLYHSHDSRSFNSQACVFISSYFGAAERLTAEERQRTIILRQQGCRLKQGKDDRTGWVLDN
jgi:hypothetical protein